MPEADNTLNLTLVGSSIAGCAILTPRNQREDKDPTPR
jgi:hypothetical protein